MGLVSCSGAMCLGHESSGLIVQLGQNVAAAASTADKRAEELTKLCGDREKAQNVVGNAALHVGDRVTLEPGTTCRMCTDCRNGRYQVSLILVEVAVRRSKLTGGRFASTWHSRLTLHSTVHSSDTTSCKCTQHKEHQVATWLSEERSD